MSEMEYGWETAAGKSRQAEQSKPKTGGRRIAKRLVPAAFALALLGTGFYVARTYILEMRQHLTDIQTRSDELNRNVVQVREILDKQHEQIGQLQERFAAIDGEMQAVKEELSLAGDSLQSADDTKKALSQRIADLSAELESLKKLIAKLEAAARVY
ncbi:hypothetical protein [Cohnella caldifontis]|uniref:hypothetical protein n=1 Tax=Cohnella caldifontis TaxID=3027471 RepID=UPI0023EC22CE|nr:hypothetical protein [Cohnella sp. YIM B05605]